MPSLEFFKILNRHIIFKIFLLSIFLFSSRSVLFAENHLPFAVVELFTSEGCSSCPPADRLLSQITQETEEKDLPVYTLSFHVDYWNYIGWTDPFSKNIFTQRQYRYAESLNSSSVYTPQMIINGTKGFSGGNQRKANDLISQALQNSAALNLQLILQKDGQKFFKLFYKLSEVTDDCRLNIAVVEKNLVSQVTQGENAGKTLRHDHVVRLFSSIDLKKSNGQVVLEIQPGWKKPDLRVIGYMQDKTTMKILGAQKINFPL